MDAHPRGDIMHKRGLRHYLFRLNFELDQGPTAPRCFDMLCLSTPNNRYDDG